MAIEATTNHFNPEEFSNRLTLLEKGLKKAEKKAKKNAQEIDSDDEGIDKKRKPSAARQAAFVAGVAVPTIALSAYATHLTQTGSAGAAPAIMLAGYVASVFGTAAKAGLRSINIGKRLAILATANAVGYTLDYVSANYTDIPPANLGPLATLTSIAVLNRELKLGLLGKKTREESLSTWVGRTTGQCFKKCSSWAHRSRPPVPLAHELEITDTEP